jgi:hypothetical protein
MIVVHSRTELAATRGDVPTPDALAPTLGAVHAGHASLIDAARPGGGASNSVLVTVFVKPIGDEPLHECPGLVVGHAQTESHRPSERQTESHNRCRQLIRPLWPLRAGARNRPARQAGNPRRSTASCRDPSDC